MEGDMWRHLQCPSVAAACVHAGFRWRAAAFTSQQLQTCLQAATTPTHLPRLCQPCRPGRDDSRSAAGGRGAEWSRPGPLCRSHHCTRPLRSGAAQHRSRQYQINNRGGRAHAPGGAANHAAVLMCSVQFAAVCVDSLVFFSSSALCHFLSSTCHAHRSCLHCAAFQSTPTFVGTHPVLHMCPSPQRCLHFFCSP